MGRQYLGICTVFSIGVFVQVAMERILQATGVTIYNMLMQGAGAITNIILDPIFIFGWFGLPGHGRSGRGDCNPLSARSWRWAWASISTIRKTMRYP